MGQSLLQNGLFQRGKVAIIDAHRSALGVEPSCRLLPIAPSTYYEVISKRNDVHRLSVRVRRDIAMKVDLTPRQCFCDQQLVMKAGKIVASGTPQDVLTRELLRDLFSVEAHVSASPIMRSRTSISRGDCCAQSPS
ncbi:hypothetical protein [Agrobacterium tumefaciens]|uniref:hypothetical protein n=1 Tax=Agrobacterium tumefaciens TaxID=358 RepID=UPI0027869C03|nr:ABC-type cobalamin transport system ATPase subunit [Agrobacterium tumefaciens]